LDLFQHPQMDVMRGCPWTWSKYETLWEKKTGPVLGGWETPRGRKKAGKKSARGTTPQKGIPQKGSPRGSFFPHILGRQYTPQSFLGGGPPPKGLCYHTPQRENPHPYSQKRGSTTPFCGRHGHLVLSDWLFD